MSASSSRSSSCWPRSSAGSIRAAAGRRDPRTRSRLSRRHDPFELSMQAEALRRQGDPVGVLQHAGSDRDRSGESEPRLRYGLGARAPGQPGRGPALAGGPRNSGWSGRRPGADRGQQRTGEPERGRLAAPDCGRIGAGLSRNEPRFPRYSRGRSTVSGERLNEGAGSGCSATETGMALLLIVEVELKK